MRLLLRAHIGAAIADIQGFTHTIPRRAQKTSPAQFFFSLSATVYGAPASVPIRESFPRAATNPYGRSKLMTEDILADLHLAEPD